MKKVLKRILLGFGIILIIIIGVVVGYAIKTNSELKTMSPLETMEITNNIYAIRDSYVNLFVIQDSSQYIVIDGGMNPELISEELKKFNIDPEVVTAVLLTHSDGDHVAAISIFRHAEIYLSNQEEQMINGTTKRVSFYKNSIDSKEYTLLEDQQIIHIGNIKIKGILTPGHTPGSMCYLLNDRFLFTGDAISIKDGKIEQFNKYFNMDTETAVRSIEKLASIPDIEYIFTAHHGYSDDVEHALADWKK